MSTRRRESCPPASSTSPSSRSGIPLRGCCRSWARSRPKPGWWSTRSTCTSCARPGASCWPGRSSTSPSGSGLPAELNAYRWADAVLTVSSNEARLLGEFLGPERIHDIPLAQTRAAVAHPLRGSERDPVPRQLPPPAERRGGRVSLPRRPAAAQPGSPRRASGGRGRQPSRRGRRRAGRRAAERQDGRLGALRRALPRACAGLASSRCCTARASRGRSSSRWRPGTPVVTTTIGAEGIELRHGDHVLIADTPEELADGLAHLLTDRAQWERLADAGYEQAAATHAPERVAERFEEIIDSVLAAPPRWQAAHVPRQWENRARRRIVKRGTRSRRRCTSITAPGSTALVVSRGDDALLACEGRRTAHFPQGPDGGWAGFNPADSAEAIEHLETLREQGARYFVVPSSQFWWLHHYSELTEHLEAAYRRIYSGRPPDRVRPRSRSRGRRAATADRPAAGSGCSSSAPTTPLAAHRPRGSSRSCDRAERFEVRQRWQPAGPGAAASEDGEADWILHVDAAAVLPTRFVDDFLGIVSTCPHSASSAHNRLTWPGREAGPPVTERLRGVLGREVEATTPLPVLAVRSGAEREGPTVLVDAVPIALAGPIRSDAGSPRATATCATSSPRHGDGPRRAVQRRHETRCAADQRPDRHLRAAGAARGVPRRLLRPDAAAVRVRGGGRRRRLGGSGDAARAGGLRHAPAADRRTRIDHSGRSAAKNLAVLLARGDLVLFFDDDDRPAPDLLDEHVRAHARHPGDGDGRPRAHRLGPAAGGLAPDALPHRRRPADLRLWELRAGRGDRLARVLGGARLVEALAARAPRPARPAARVLDRRGARVAVARSGSRGRLPPGGPQRDVAADRPRRVLPPLRGEGACAGGHRIPPRRPGDP